MKMNFSSIFAGLVLIFASLQITFGHNSSLGSNDTADTTNSYPDSCQHIKRGNMPSFKEIADIGTFTADLTIDPMFDNSIVMFVHSSERTKKETGALGNVIVAIGDTYFTMNGIFGSELVNTTNCKYKQDVIWYMHNYVFSKNGSYYCVFSCKGHALQHYGCASTKPKFALKQAENLASLKNVPGIKGVHSATINTCQTNKNFQCKMGNLDSVSTATNAQSKNDQLFWKR